MAFSTCPQPQQPKMTIVYKDQGKEVTLLSVNASPQWSTPMGPSTSLEL